MSGPPLRVAVLGTGGMGEPIAANLLAAGFPVTVWNRSAEKATALGDAGARVACSAAEAAERAEVLITMLADGAATEEVMTAAGGALESLRRGAVWVQMATVGLEWTDRLAALAAARGIELVDAPVSGSDGPARDAELVVLASGPQELRAIVEPIFDAVGRRTLWLGPAGQGTRLKLVLNNWLAAEVEAVAETIALAEALGVRPHLFTDTLADSPLGSPYAIAKGRAMMAGDLEPGFPLRLAFKDVILAMDAAQAHRLDLPITTALAGRWEDAVDDGHGDDDVSAVIEVASRAYLSGAAGIETVS